MAKLLGKIAVVAGGTSGMALAPPKMFVDEGAYAFVTGPSGRAKVTNRSLGQGNKPATRENAGEVTPQRCYAKSAVAAGAAERNNLFCASHCVAPSIAMRNCTFPPARIATGAPSR
jgi:hypothetical protein